MRKILLTILIFGLSACSPPVANPQIAGPIPRGSVMLRSFATQQQDISAIIKQLYQKHMADDVLSMQDLDEISQELEKQGISIFKSLHDNASLRSAVYPYSQQMLIREFTRPSKADNIPAITPENRARLKQLLKPGDVILCGNNGSFVHAMLYTGQGQVIHSLAVQPGSGQQLWGVLRESLDTYFNRSERDTFVVLRARDAQEGDLQNAIRYAGDQLGKGYDTLFLLNLADRFYCTELVYHALKHMKNSPRVFPHKVRYGWHMVTVEDFMDSPDFQTIWELNYQRPPIGRLHRY